MLRKLDSLESTPVGDWSWITRHSSLTRNCASKNSIRCDGFTLDTVEQCDNIAV